MTLLAGVTVLEVGFDVGRRLLPLGEISVLFESYNRNKRSVVADLTSDGGRAVFRDLVAVADLVVTNLRPEFLEKAGITWDEVRAVNPRAILALVTSFGIDDEESNAAGGDVVAQAESGLASFNGEPGGAPLIAQNAPADVAGAMYAAVAMLAAYVEAQRTGVGRVIDLSLVDVYATLDVGITPMVLATGGRFQPGPTGRFHPSFTPHGVFRGAGGWIVISGYGTGANSMWPRVARAIGREDLADAAGYRSDAERGERREEIVELIEGWLATFDTADDAVRVLRDAGVIAATVRTPYEVVTSERALRRRLVERVEHPVAGPLDVVGLPLRIGGFEPAMRPAPLLGADTRTVLRELLGYGDERISDLADGGAIATEGG